MKLRGRKWKLPKENCLTRIKARHGKVKNSREIQRICIRAWSEKLKRRDHVGDVGVYGPTILKWFLW